MEKLDRLGWAAGMAFVSYGVRLGIRVSSPEILDRIEGVLPPHVRPARAPRVDGLYSLITKGTKVGSNRRRFNILYVGARRLARTRDTDEALDALEGHMQIQTIHAGAASGLHMWRKHSFNPIQDLRATHPDPNAYSVGDERHPCRPPEAVDFLHSGGARHQDHFVRVTQVRSGSG